MRNQTLDDLLTARFSKASLQKRVKACQSMDEIVATLHATGFPVTARKFQLWSNTPVMEEAFRP